MKSCYIFGHNIKEKKNPEHRWSRFECSICHDTYEYKDKKWENTFWESETWMWIKVIAAVITAIILVSLFLYAIVSLTAIPGCNEYARMGIETKWNFWTMCMANHPKFGWVPIDKYFEILNLYVK